MKKIITGFLVLMTFSLYAQKTSLLPPATGTGKGSLINIVQSGANKKILSDSLINPALKYADSLQAIVTAALAGKQATLVSGGNLKSVNGLSLLGSGNVVISGSGGTTTNIDSNAYRFATVTADSLSLILTTLNGRRDTISLSPGALDSSKFLFIQNSGANGLLKSLVFQSGVNSTIPPTAIGNFTGLNLANGGAPDYGGIIGSDQGGNFFTRASNGTVWKTVVTNENIGNYAPTNGVAIVAGGAPGTYPTAAQFRTGILGTAPTGSVGQINGYTFPNSGAANYGGIMASDQNGAFWLKTNNGTSNWRTVVDEVNIANFALTNANGVGYSQATGANANNITGNAMNYAGVNIPVGADGLTAINYPYGNLSNYGNQLGFERYGKLYTRNQGGGTFGAWKQIAQFLEGTATYAAPVIASMGTTTTTIGVTGAVLGNYAHVAFGINLQGIVATAYVSAADVVTIVLFNPTGAAISLASTIVKVKAE